MKQKQRGIQYSLFFASEVNASEGENSLQPTTSNDSRINMDNFFTRKLRQKIKISKGEKTDSRIGNLRVKSTLELFFIQKLISL